MRRALLALMLFAVAPSSASAMLVQRAKGRGTDSTKVRKEAQADIERFLMEWRKAWFAARNTRDTTGGSMATFGARQRHTHCHVDGSGNGPEQWRLRAGYQPVQGGTTAFAKCPTWLLGSATTDGDEGDSIDVALRNVDRPAVRAARRTLLARLEAAARSIPGDAWLTGQRVRFLGDQREWEAAAAVAHNCTASGWWCTALSGYVLVHQGHLSAADSAFAHATAVLPPSSRCEWTGVRELIQSDSRKVVPEFLRMKYDALPCSAQDSLARQYWWLADPSWGDGINERRTEHYARKILVLLRSALAESEMYPWRLAAVRDAQAEMIIRYGWPSQTVWGGRGLDGSHSDYLKMHGTAEAEPYSTAEYSPGRIQYGVHWDAVLDPFSVTSEAWQFRMPNGEVDVGFLGDASLQDKTMWWPQEHMRPADGWMAELPEGQLALLRRQTNVRLLSAIEPSAGEETSDELVTLFADETTRALRVSSGPDSIELLSRQSGEWPGRMFFDAVMNPRPVVVDIEVKGTKVRVAARLRGGLTPPPPLRDLAAGAIAISEPIFFEGNASAPPPADLDAMLPKMLGRTRIAVGTTVGVFWETYGLSARDSVRFKVNVSPVDEPGLLRRLGSALRIINEAADAVTIGWQDTRQRNARANAGNGVTIEPRSLYLNLSQLPAGSYWVEVEASTAKSATVRAKRGITIR